MLQGCSMHTCALLIDASGVSHWSAWLAAGSLPQAGPDQGRDGVPPGKPLLVAGRSASVHGCWRGVVPCLLQADRLLFVCAVSLVDADAQRWDCMSSSASNV